MHINNRERNDETRGRADTKQRICVSISISAVTVKVQFPRSQSVFISFLESEIARAILVRRSIYIPGHSRVERGDTLHGRRDGLHLQPFARRTSNKFRLWQTVFYNRTKSYEATFAYILYNKVLTQKGECLLKNIYHNNQNYCNQCYNV